MTRAASTFALRANSGQYKSEMAGATKSTKNLSDSQVKLGESANRSKKSVDDFSKQLEIGRKRLNKFGKAAIVAGGALVTGIVTKGLESGDQLAKTADKLGIATESLARFRFAAQQTGVEQSKADVAMQRFTRRLADAAAGAGPAVKAFDALGLEASQLQKLAPDEAFAKVADQMNKVENQSQKVSLAFKLFDSEGVGLVNTMALGSEGLARLGAEAEAAGLALSRVDAAKLEAANDEMAKVASGFTGFSQQLAVKFAPLIGDIADRLFGVGQEAGGMAEVAGKAFNFMLKGAGVFANGIRGIEIGWEAMKLAFQVADKFITEGLQRLSDAAVDMYNALPWVDEVEYTQMFDGLLSQMESGISQTKARLDTLLREPLPSDALEDWAETAERQFSASAKAAVEAQIDTQDALISTEEVTEALAKSTKKSADRMADSMKQSTGLITSFLQNLKTDGLGAFSTLLQGFGGMIQQMILTGSQSKIPINLAAAGVGFGGGAAGVGASGAAGGTPGAISSILSLGKTAAGLLSAGIGGLGTNLATGLSSIGLGSSVVGLQKAGAFFAPNATGVTQVGIGGLASAGAGLAGSFIGGKVFGETTGIGSTLGGLAGTALGGPVGAAIGSFIGTGLEKGLGKVFGFGQNNGNNQGFAEFNLGTGALNSDGVGKSFDQENVDRAEAFVKELALFSEQIGGSTFAGRVEIGNRSGLSFIGEGSAGKFGDDLDGALKFGIRRIIEQASALDEALKPLILDFQGSSQEIALFAKSISTINAGSQFNSITTALEEFSAVQPTLYERINASAAALRTSIDAYDGSAESVAAIAAQYDINKAAGYEYVLSLQAVGKGLSEQADQQAKAFRESVLTPEELRDARQSEFDELARTFSDLVNPEEIARAGQRRLELNAILFQTLGELPEELRKIEAENAAVRAEAIASETQATVDAISADLEQRQANSNQEISRLLLENQRFQRETAQIERDTAQQNRETAQENGQLLQETIATLNDFVRGGGRGTVPRLGNFDL